MLGGMSTASRSIIIVAERGDVLGNVPGSLYWVGARRLPGMALLRKKRPNTFHLGVWLLLRGIGIV